VSPISKWTVSFAPPGPRRKGAENGVQFVEVRNRPPEGTRQK
jgi:hypothetical protein